MKSVIFYWPIYNEMLIAEKKGNKWFLSDEKGMLCYYPDLSCFEKRKYIRICEL